MDNMSHNDHGPASDPHAGHKMSGMHGSHDRHAGHSVAMFRDKFWLSLALTIPVVFWSTDVQHWLGYAAPSFPGSKFIPATLGTVVFVYGGLVFIRGAGGELADHKPGMMTLISLAIIVAFGTSLALPEKSRESYHHDSNHTWRVRVPVNPEAQHAYWKARYFLNGRRNQETRARKIAAHYRNELFDISRRLRQRFHDVRYGGSAAPTRSAPACRFARAPSPIPGKVQQGWND
jgi:hypothetical protein